MKTGEAPEAPDLYYVMVLSVTSFSQSHPRTTTTPQTLFVWNHVVVRSREGGPERRKWNHTYDVVHDMINCVPVAVQQDTRALCRKSGYEPSELWDRTRCASSEFVSCNL